MSTIVVAALLAAFLWRLARAFARDVRSGCCCSGCSGCAGCHGCGGSCASCGGCSARR